MADPTQNQRTGVTCACDSPTSLSSSSSDKLGTKKYSIDQALFETLQGKGFGNNAIKKSIVAGCIDESTCTQWITMHEGHPELDTPLADDVEVVVRERRVLTEAERKAKVRELKEKIRLKKEEENRNKFEEERRRIEMGRKALEAQELREKLSTESSLAAIRQQKKEDAAARHKVKLQLLADKYVRQGMSLQDARSAAEAELNEDLRKKREDHLAANAGFFSGAQEGAARGALFNVSKETTRAVPLRGVFGKPVEPPSFLPSLVERIRGHPDTILSRSCLTTLQTILRNILENPFDMAKRSLKTSTNAFCTRIAPVEPAIQLLRTCGFQLANDANGEELLTAPTVVIRVIKQALALLLAEL